MQKQCLDAEAASENGDDSETKSDSDNTKSCTRCNEQLDYDLFRKCAKAWDGYDSVCKPCRKEIYVTRLEDAKYKEKLAKLRAKNHSENRQKYNERHKENFQANKAEIMERRKLYYKGNPNKRMIENCRVRVREAYNGKNRHTFDYIGCTPEFLTEWINFQLEKSDDMSPDNYGEYWHIDHVIPCFQWDLDNPEEVTKAFHWTNLSPLQAVINLSKNKSISEDDIIEQNEEIAAFSKIKKEEFPLLALPISKTHNCGKSLKL